MTEEEAQLHLLGSLIEANEIYSHYIDIGAPNELNPNPTMRANIRGALDQLLLTAATANNFHINASNDDQKASQQMLLSPNHGNTDVSRDRPSPMIHNILAIHSSVPHSTPNNSADSPVRHLIKLHNRSGVCVSSGLSYEETIRLEYLVRHIYDDCYQMIINSLEDAQSFIRFRATEQFNLLIERLRLGRPTTPDSLQRRLHPSPQTIHRVHKPGHNDVASAHHTDQPITGAHDHHHANNDVKHSPSNDTVAHNGTNNANDNDNSNDPLHVIIHQPPPSSRFDTGNVEQSVLNFGQSASSIVGAEISCGRSIMTSGQSLFSPSGVAATSSGLGFGGTALVQDINLSKSTNHNAPFLGSPSPSPPPSSQQQLQPIELLHHHHQWYYHHSSIIPTSRVVLPPLAVSSSPSHVSDCSSS
jgi:hypothetical protein